MEITYTPLNQRLPRYSGAKSFGCVTAIGGPLITAKIPFSAVGDLCKIPVQNRSISAQVVSFKDNIVKLAPLDDPHGIHPGSVVINSGLPLIIYPPSNLLGKIIDVMGQELQYSTKTQPSEGATCNTYKGVICIDRKPPEPLARPQIQEQMFCGVKCIDAFCPIGYGQRLGLFAGPGVGKSTLLGIIAAQAQVDVTVIALVGERSREVPDFINDVLGSGGLEKSVVVVATSDECAARRALAPQTATAIAEHFRDQGLNVLLLVDSLTRTARALREVGLAAGEIPVRQGFPASVYAELPKILERAGTAEKGSITGIYTVLTQGEQAQDALSEEVKSLLDGHIALDPAIAEKGILPAFDITTSISRLQSKLLTKRELVEVRALKAAAASLKKNKEILLFGGTPDPELKAALKIEDDLNNFIIQSPLDRYPKNIKEIISKIARTYTQSIKSIH